MKLEVSYRLKISEIIYKYGCRMTHLHYSSSQEKLIKYVTDSETVEPVISQLVTVLLIGCQDANSQARLLCGECLGELGAIDPGRLDFSTSETQGKHFTFVVRSIAIVFCLSLGVL